MVPAVGRPDDTGDARGVALGIALPIGVLAFAYVLWWISDRVVYVGPLDKAAFGWVVVVPIWLLAPLAAGWTWRDLAPRASAVARLIVGLIVTTVVALLFWVATTEPGCEFRPDNGADRLGVAVIPDRRTARWGARGGRLACGTRNPRPSPLVGGPRRRIYPGGLRRPGARSGHLGRSLPRRLHTPERALNCE